MNELITKLKAKSGQWPPEARALAERIALGLAICARGPAPEAVRKMLAADVAMLESRLSRSSSF